MKREREKERKRIKDESNGRCSKSCFPIQMRMRKGRRMSEREEKERRERGRQFEGLKEGESNE